MKVWIDLDNTPHVPLFAPVARALEMQGHSVLFTARDCFQVCGLADLIGLKYRKCGKHFGGNKVMKVVGLGTRAAQLAPIALRERPDLALSHGSRAQLLLAKTVGIPTILMMDYEFARGLVLMRPDWLLAPELIPDSAFQCDPARILRYPGIKEDVYAPSFQPDPALRSELGLDDKDVIVVLRPPAQQAHYHVAQSDELFKAVMDLLGKRQGVKVIVLPRNGEQGEWIQRTWPDLFARGQMLIPERAIDGLNLIWHADLVISGGGTMNREAAALGVPVYSIFRGKIGAIDDYLSKTGRLILLESVSQLEEKLRLEKRSSRNRSAIGQSAALHAIVQNILRITEEKCKVPQLIVSQ